MSATKINGAEIRGGTITSNTTIDVTTDLKIGNNIIFMDGQSSSPQTIVFPGRGSITFKTDGVEVGSYNSLNLQCTYTTVNNEEVATKPWVLTNAYAKFK
ncbi:hypothetical protein D3C76_279540 [compost metagenome]